MGSKDYEYPIEEIRLQNSLACLEPSVFEQFAFFKELVKAIPISNLWEDEEEEKTSNSSSSMVSEKCDNVGY